MDATPSQRFMKKPPEKKKTPEKKTGRRKPGTSV
jgi:hypothetical protein